MQAWVTLNWRIYMKLLGLLRHEESIWNKENRFTGWTDVDLSLKGIDEARAAGQRMHNDGYVFDIAYTSVLKRAIRTLWLVQDEMDLMLIPVFSIWRLNDGHYGTLRGLNKQETVDRHGETQVKLWRRSYDIRPPALAPDDPRTPYGDPRYEQLRPDQIPLTESLKDTVDRVLVVWNETIAPTLRAGARVLIASHGNSLRALVKHLDKISDEKIVDLNIPTGIPLVYELDNDLAPIRSFYLGDAAAVEQAVRAVKDQTRAKD